MLMLVPLLKGGKLQQRPKMSLQTLLALFLLLLCVAQGFRRQHVLTLL